MYDFAYRIADEPVKLHAEVMAKHGGLGSVALCAGYGPWLGRSQPVPVHELHGDGGR